MYLFLPYIYTYVFMLIRMIYLHKYAIHIYRIMVRRNPPPDRDKVKIASFRISEGEWFDFSEEADRQNVTATDVIKGAIRNFMAGDFVMPEPIKPAPETSTSGLGADIEGLVSTAVNTAIGKLSILGIDRVTEIARNEVELAVSPLSNDLLNLQAQLAEVKSDCDLTTEGIQRLIADAISKSSIATATAKKPHSPATKTASTGTTQPNPETMKMVGRLQKNPELKAKAEKGLAEGLGGKALCDWLFEQGYGANNNANAFNPSVGSVLKLAIEYLTSLENGVQG
jgi:hypothetical protein